MDHSSRRQIRQEELLCSLDFGVKPGDSTDVILAKKELQEEQYQTCRHLAEVFNQGGENVAVDHTKAEKYATIVQMCGPLGADGWHTSDVYKKTSEYNHARIFLIRLNLLSQFYFKQDILPKWMPFLGLLYGPMFCFDVGVVIKTVFDPERTKDEQELVDQQGEEALRLQRLKNIIQKDERISRMFNAGFWFALNIMTFSAYGAAIFLTSPASEILIACGCGVDILHEVTVGAVDIYHHASYLNEIKAKIGELDTQIQQAEKTSAPPEIIKPLHRERLKFRIQAAQLENKIDDVLEARALHLLKSIIILGGVAMMLFPPTLVPGAILTTLGIGISLYFWIQEKRQQHKEAVKLLKPANDPQIKNTSDLTRAMQLAATATQNSDEPLINNSPHAEERAPLLDRQPAIVDAKVPYSAGIAPGSAALVNYGFQSPKPTSKLETLDRPSLCTVKA